MLSRRSKRNPPIEYSNDGAKEIHQLNTVEHSNDEQKKSNNSIQ